MIGNVKYYGVLHAMATGVLLTMASSLQQPIQCLLSCSRSSFKGNRDKIKEGKNLMSVIALGEALNFLDRTTKDRARAQSMKKYLQEDVIPKLVSQKSYPPNSVTFSHTQPMFCVSYVPHKRASSAPANVVRIYNGLVFRF